MAQELRGCCHTAPSWVMLGASAFIDYLARLADGADRGRAGYIDFIRTWMSQVRKEYVTFQYNNGTSDLPQQMYYVLRCGIVHSFSLIPDSLALKHGGRNRSIVFCYRFQEEVRRQGIQHLASHRDASSGIDAAVLVGEDLVSDIESVVQLLFQQANSNKALSSRMTGWISSHPPIGPLP